MLQAVEHLAVHLADDPAAAPHPRHCASAVLSAPKRGSILLIQADRFGQSQPSSASPPSSTRHQNGADCRAHRTIYSNYMKVLDLTVCVAAGGAQCRRAHGGQCAGRRPGPGRARHEPRQSLPHGPNLAPLVLRATTLRLFSAQCFLAKPSCDTRTYEFNACGQIIQQRM